jgi:hypothetical protein
MYTNHCICPELRPKSLCFCVREYREGLFHTVFHEHIPAQRMAQDTAQEALRSLIARYSLWPGEWILRSLLNHRVGQPQRYPGYSYDASYPESGVLRHTVSGTGVHAWFDTVISSQQFRS